MKLYKTKKNCGKLLLGILAFCTGMILLTGCGSSSEQKQNKNEETAEENKEEDKVQIGLTVDSFVIERWIRDRDVFVATARELGAEVNVQDAGADVKEQISQIEYFINKQVCDRCDRKRLWSTFRCHTEGTECGNSGYFL